MRARLIGVLLVMVLVMVLSVARVARADATVFIGAAGDPANRQVRGFAVGVSLLVVGFEFEYAHAVEDLTERAPSLKTGSGNIFFQTPFPIAGLLFYYTAGGGLYREELGTLRETNFGVNTGGGVKVSLAGPLRLRVDYRLFKLLGNPAHGRPQRVYVGLNLAF